MKSENADVIIVDGSALLWTIHCTTDGSVADFIMNVKCRIAGTYLTVTFILSLTGIMSTVQNPPRGMEMRQ